MEGTRDYSRPIIYVIVLYYPVYFYLIVFLPLLLTIRFPPEPLLLQPKTWKAILTISLCSFSCCFFISTSIFISNISSSDNIFLLFSLISASIFIFDISSSNNIFLLLLVYLFLFILLSLILIA
jgi:hypothetical protein